MAGLAIASLALAAGCGSGGTAATAGDRAACRQLGTAFDAFVAWHSGPPPADAYRKAIAVAKTADNTKLRNAITDWMNSEITQIASQQVGPEVGYAEDQCRRIGLPLRVKPQGANSP
jgi:hypothetical protein